MKDEWSHVNWYKMIEHLTNHIVTCKAGVMWSYVFVAQSCPALCNPINYSPPGSSVQGILQARVLECVTIPFSRGSSPPSDQRQVSCIAGGLFAIWATREALFLSSRGQTEWKPQSQKTNHSDHMDTALSNSVILGAMRYRATQDE